MQPACTTEGFSIAELVPIYCPASTQLLPCVLLRTPVPMQGHFSGTPAHTTCRSAHRQSHATQQHMHSQAGPLAAAAAAAVGAIPAAAVTTAVLLASYAVQLLS